MPITFAAVATADKLVPVGFSQITAGFAAAQGLGTIPDGAALALIQPVSGPVRFRDDGTAPTDAIGMIVGDGDTIQYPGDLTAFQFINDAGSGVTEVNITFYRYGV